MLFEVTFTGQSTSIVLSKIVGIADCGGSGGVVNCHIYTDGDPDGFRCSESYSTVCARLHAALENAEAQKHLTTAPCRAKYRPKFAKRKRQHSAHVG